MFKLVFKSIFLVVVFSQPIFAQAPFAQVGQMPLLTNSSLAGSSGKQRISLGWNNSNSASEKNSNYAASYDQVWRKLGSGIGAYYLFQQNKNGLVSDIQNANFGSQAFDGNFLNTNSFHQAGICFAPKFNVMKTSNPREIKFTFSPSLFFDFQASTKKSNQAFNQTTFHSTLYSVDFPNGKQLTDSVWDSNLSFVDKTLKYSSGIGLLLNTSNLIVMSQSKFTTETTTETVQLTTYYQGKQKSNNAETKLKQTLYSFDQNVNIGMSFSRNKESKFSFTPFAGIGIKHYLNLGTKSSDSTETAIYSYNLTSKKRTDWNYFHLSTNFKYSKFLFGAGFTRLSNFDYSGIQLGFQNKWMKLMGNFNAGIGANNDTAFKSEITLGLNL